MDSIEALFTPTKPCFICQRGGQYRSPIHTHTALSHMPKGWTVKSYSHPHSPVSYAKGVDSIEALFTPTKPCFICQRGGQYRSPIHTHTALSHMPKGWTVKSYSHPHSPVSYAKGVDSIEALFSPKQPRVHPYDI